ncbi:hypothetical protein AQ862_06775 [Burkholderia pseudomallei]|nr:hypothetical protein AQ862_06775 [Burkholderia pseudomallei]
MLTTRPLERVYRDELGPIGDIQLVEAFQPGSNSGRTLDTMVDLQQYRGFSRLYVARHRNDDTRLQMLRHVEPIRARA